MNRRLTTDHYYDYLGNENLMDEHAHLKEIAIDDLQDHINKLPGDIQERLAVAVHAYKIHQGLFRLAPSQGIKSRPVLTAAQRITAEASTSTIKKDKGYYENIFEENANREDYSELVWAVRQEFLQEIELQGGDSCPSCTRGSLIRKYTKKLQELDA